MRIKLYLLALLLVIITTRCANSSFTQTGETYPEWTGFVKVLASEPVGVKYEQIGIISSTGGTIHNKTDLIKAIQKRLLRKEQML
jgi:hypothetical protein